MSVRERRSVVALAGVFALRIFGLFMVLPVLAVYASGLPGATPFLIGLAVGGYGLSQAALQIPFGAWSDRLGRKPVILAGLMIFIVGSIVAAVADNIYGVVAGRILQGAGAIAAAVLAMVADLTRDEQRTKAMAIIGVSIGMTFILALITGPALGGVVGVDGLFWLTAALAALAMVLLARTVPEAERRSGDTAHSEGFLAAIANRRLLLLDFGIMVLHLAMTALFVVVPIALIEHAGQPLAAHWRIYVPVMLASVACMAPLVMLSSRARAVKPVFLLALAILIVSTCVFYLWGQRLWGLIGGLWLFFIGFTTLEALLPSSVSRQAPARIKGAALGVYNTCEFAGVFLGGVLAGWLYGEFGAGAVWIVVTVVLAVWLVLSLFESGEVRFQTLSFRLDPGHPASGLLDDLAQLEGVVEVTAVHADRTGVIRFNPAVIDRDAVVNRLETMTAERENQPVKS